MEVGMKKSFHSQFRIGRARLIDQRQENLPVQELERISITEAGKEFPAVCGREGGSFTVPFSLFYP